MPIVSALDSFSPQLATLKKQMCDMISYLRSLGIVLNISSAQRGCALQSRAEFLASEAITSAFVGGLMPISYSPFKQLHDCGLRNLLPSTFGSSDGFFQAVSFVVTGSVESHPDIRRKTIFSILSSPEYYKSSIGDIPSLSKYAEKFGRKDSWAPELLILACAIALDRPIIRWVLNTEFQLSPVLFAGQLRPQSSGLLVELVLFIYVKNIFYCI